MDRFKLVVCAGLILMLSSGLVFADADAPENPSVMLILDGSGSMWGEMDGNDKIVIAREAIDDLLIDWPGA